MFVAGDVFGDVLASALGVAHFAEDAAAGAGDAFDGEGALVRIGWFGHGRGAVWLAVLSGDLTVGGELLKGVVAGEEAAFAVGDGDGVEVADLAVGEPRAVGVRDAGGDVGGDVACDGVVGEGHVFAEEAGFDEGLEAVADAEDEALAVLVEVGDGIGDLGVAQDGGDEFGGAIGFVAGAEATGEHENLRLGDGGGEGLQGFFDCLRGEVAEDEDFGVASRLFEGGGSVVFAVGAREDGDDNFGLAAEEGGGLLDSFLAYRWE